nr:MAG TPA: hypothetical protein [Caudoviricetes sp.]
MGDFISLWGKTETKFSRNFIFLKCRYFNLGLCHRYNFCSSLQKPARISSTILCCRGNLD